MAKSENRALRSEVDSLRREVKRLRKELRERTVHLARLLKRRGFTVYKKEPSTDLLLPGPRFRDRYFALLHKYSFRLFLRDAIRYRHLFTAEKLTRYSTAKTVRSYIAALEEMGLAKSLSEGYGLTRPVRSFGPTLEWYVAELLTREFGAETIWGVKFRRPEIGGDYDVIAKLDGSLLYLEVKSSPPKQIYDSEVDAFLERVNDLAPESAVFLMDTELRMKDKLVPMFEAALARKNAYPPPVVRIERELFGIDGRVFIVNAKESILQNIGVVVAGMVRKKGVREREDLLDHSWNWSNSR